MWYQDTGCFRVGASYLEFSCRYSSDVLSDIVCVWSWGLVNLTFERLGDFERSDDERLRGFCLGGESSSCARKIWNEKKIISGLMLVIPISFPRQIFTLSFSLIWVQWEVARFLLQWDLLLLNIIKVHLSTNCKHNINFRRDHIQWYGI